MSSWKLSFVVSLAGIALGLASCAPQARHTACANDGQCESIGGEFHYCLESRCVECVGSSSGGDKRTCVDGRCLER